MPVVQFIKTSPQTGTHDLRLPCNVQANQSTAIFTRTTGYLLHWYFDIGQHVNQGQVMAVIDTPEVDAQLKQSQAAELQNEAAVKKAEADQDLAQKTLDRYLESAKQSPGSVTKEAIDQNESALKDAIAALNQARANVEAAKANVQQLTTQVGFEKVYAPFSGIVTARHYDNGALLSPTNNAPGTEIFDLDQTDPLRVFINVPQEYANQIKIGDKAILNVRNYPTTSFEGIITLTSGALDPNTRTLNVQINFDNKKGLLYKNMYGEIRLPLTDPENVGLIPTGALVFNAQSKGNQVATVTDVQEKEDHKKVGKVHMKSIKTGRDFGTTIEVTAGLSPSDLIITNPSERTTEGAEVDAREAPKGTVPASQPSDGKLASASR
jgi:RND family efflux transporter MFP subunit